MQLVHRSTQISEARLIQSILETNGIRGVVRNDIVQSLSGEVPFTSMWPEVWVFDESDAERARELIANKPSEVEQADWVCASCGEENGGAFDACWKCGSYRDLGESNKR